MTFAEIGQELGVSPQRVEQIYRTALKKLHKSPVLRVHADYRAPMKKKTGPKPNLNPMPTCKHCHRKAKTRSSELCDRHYWQWKRGEEIKPIQKWTKRARA